MKRVLCAGLATLALAGGFAGAVAATANADPVPAGNNWG
jgi:hypothetical protein